MKITNQRSYPLDLEGHVAGPGESIDVPDDLGRAAIEQPDNWAPTNSTTTVGARGPELHVPGSTNHHMQEPKTAVDGDEKESTQ